MGIPGVAPLQNDLDTPPHGARAPGIGDLATVYLGLDAQVPFDTGDRIYDDSFCHDYSSLAFVACCTATAPTAPTTTPAATPTAVAATAFPSFSSTAG